MFGATQSGTQTITQNRQVPPWLEGPLKKGIEGASNYYQGYQSDPNTLAGLQGMAGLGQDPNQYGYGNVLNNFSGLMAGDNLYGGSGFDAYMTAAQNQIQPRVQSAFNRSGRLNSGLAQTAMNQGLADSFAGLYNQERNRQMQGLQLAPQMAQFANSPNELLYNAGQMSDNEPESNLDDFIRRLQGAGEVAGYSQDTNTPLYENDWLNALGIGSSLLGLGQGLFGSGGGGGLLSGIGDFFSGDGLSNGIFDPSGDGSFDPGVFGDSGGAGGIPIPPGGGSLVNGALGGDGFSGFFGGGAANSGAAGISPVLGQLGGPGGAAFGLGAGALPAGFGSAAAGSAAPVGFGLSQAFAPAAGATGGVTGAAAGSTAAAAPGGALAGGLGTALGAAAPIALAAFGAMRQGAKHDAQRQFLNPILDNLNTAFQSGQTVTVDGVTGVPFQTPEGKTLIAAGSTANPANRNNGRALAAVYDPETGQYGTYSMGGFFGGNAPPASQAQMASAAALTGFNPGDAAAKAAHEQAVSDYMAKQLDLGNLSYGD